MTDSDLELRILHHVTQPSYRPAKPRLIARQLGIDPSEVVEVRRAIKHLVSQGRLRYGPRHLVTVATESDPRECIGRFRRAADGYGFVRPQTGSASPRAEDDVFIPASKTHDAADGDTVLVRLTRQPRGTTARVVGEVMQVMKRRTHQFVGTYAERLGRGYVQVDGNEFTENIPVVDAQVKRVRPDDKIVVEIVSFPSSYAPGEAVITEVLGTRGESGLDTRLILREYSLPEFFPAEVVKEARSVAEQFSTDVGDAWDWGPTTDQDRRDLTEWTTITIDPEDAKDFDDAVSLRKNADGSWQLGVHIADVTHFVGEGTALDEEARQRGTSVYLPDLVIPMLPEIVSNHLASLQPERVRFTRTVLIDFSAEGIRGDARIFRSAIRSDRRFTYEEVDAFLDDPQAWRRKLPATQWLLLHHMYELAMCLRQRRMRYGSLEINMPEIHVDLDDDGHVRSARREIQTPSHQIIEEFMVAANLSVAERLRDAKRPFLRRLHEPPRQRRIEKLEIFLRHLGLPPRNLRNRFAIKDVLLETAGTSLEPVVHLAVLKSMAKARYSPEAIGHFALASECYCHFTSPIRRYPDLLVHRALDRLAAGEPAQPPYHVLMHLGEECSELEQRAERAEQELTRLKLLSYFEERRGQTFSAVVTGVEPFGVFVKCDPVPGEGLIPRERLPGHYQYDRQRMMLTTRHPAGNFHLGDVIEVQVAQVDSSLREIDFDYLRHLERFQIPHTWRGGSRQSDQKRKQPGRRNPKKPRKRRQK